MFSIYYGRESNINYLLEHGADPNIQDTDGKSLLDYGNENTKSLILTHEKIKHFSLASILVQLRLN